MEKEIAKVIKYFSFFAYHPTLDEIYTFLRVKINKQKLKYTPPQYSIRRKISQKKLNNWRFRAYLRLISLFPQIKLIGLSGSISMMNAKEDDDIDLFIITAKNRLFTGRLITLALAQIFGLRRHRQFRKLDTVFFNRHTPMGPLAIVSKKVSSLSKNKVCLNLFFDESNLKVPKFKQTEFVGHEVLQMKSLVVKDNIHEKFLEANKWVFRLFPNAVPPVIPVKTGIQTKYIPLTFNFIELILKKFQLRSINKHKTSEIITPTQLWFHPDDFEKKLRRLK